MLSPLELQASRSAEGSACRWEHGPGHASIQAASPLPAETASPPTPQVILLAEDNDDLREVMRVFLEVMGYVVIACRDALVAAKAFHAGHTIDMLLTDIEMPGKSGVELARELTAQSPRLPVLIVSGAVIPGELTREIQDRNWSFLSKPYAFPALLITIQALLGSMQELAA